MSALAKKLPFLLVSLGIFSVLTACLFSASPAFSMDTNQHGNMDGCVFTGKTALCNMSVTEHISRWQNLFTAIPQKIIDLLLALSFALFAFIISNKVVRSPDQVQFHEQRLYVRQFRTLGIVTPLQLALSRGILHPQIYNPISR